MKSMKARPTIAVCLCLFFVAVLVWRLAGDGFNPSRLFGAPDLANSVPALDSFSEPSVGLALLKQRATDLMFAYQENRNQNRCKKAPPQAPEPGRAQSVARRLPSIGPPRLRFRHSGSFCSSAPNFAI